METIYGLVREIVNHRAKATRDHRTANSQCVQAHR